MTSKKIKLKSGLIYRNKKLVPGDVIEVPENVYNHFKEINKKRTVVAFDDSNEKVTVTFEELKEESKKEEIKK